MRLSVLPGLGRLLNHIAPDGGDSLDFTSPESCMKVDASEGGYGAIIPRVMDDWVRIGTLVGLRAHTTDSWRAGHHQPHRMR